MTYFFHEHLHRGAAALDALKTAPVTICGAGALGANLAESLARSGCGRLRVIDRDRIEARNLSTQPYQRDDIGAYKATILAHALYRAAEADVEDVPKELTADNVRKLLRGSTLVIDAFDNSPSRHLVTAWCREAAVPCLHVGLADGYAEVVWNEVYRVPSAAQDDVCAYPLARSLVLLAIAVASEAVLWYLVRGERCNYAMTLGDFRVTASPVEAV